MNARNAIVALGVVGLLVAAGWLATSGRSAGGSALSRAGGGWLAARLYLERRGASTELWDRPLEELVAPGSEPGEGLGPGAVLVLAFPWQRPPSREDLDALGHALRSGATVVLGFASPERSTAERAVLDSLDLRVQAARDDPPLAPLAWWRWARQRWTLEPGPGWSAAEAGQAPPAPVTTPIRRAPRPPREARVLLTGGEREVPLAFSLERFGGRLVVLPATLVSNALLGEGGNADLLESLLAWGGSRWIFDEYHHGLVAPQAAAEAAGHQRVFDLFLIHTGVLYALAVVALVRRFGRPWRAPTVLAGSNAAALLDLGALHHQLGHHAVAGALLVERARELDSRLELPAGLEARARTAGPEDLGRIAAEVSGHQRPGR